MAKGSKRREKAERDLEEARAKLIELQQRHARTREKGAQRIEQVKQQTEKKTAAAAQRVQRQLGRVTRAEQRLQQLRAPHTPEEAAERLEKTTAERAAKPETGVVMPGGPSEESSPDPEES